jgi:hypothetical protein
MFVVRIGPGDGVPRKGITLTFLAVDRHSASGNFERPVRERGARNEQVICFLIPRGDEKLGKFERRCEGISDGPQARQRHLSDELK